MAVIAVQGESGIIYKTEKQLRNELKKKLSKAGYENSSELIDNSSYEELEDWYYAVNFIDNRGHREQ